MISHRRAAKLWEIAGMIPLLTKTFPWVAWHRIVIPARTHAERRVRLLSARSMVSSYLAASRWGPREGVGR